jgi:hypothetical protein
MAVVTVAVPRTSPHPLLLASLGDVFVIQLGATEPVT